MRKRFVLLPWLAALSLALNVFLGTVLALREPGPKHPLRPFGPPDPIKIAERMSRDLPAADAAILRNAFIAHSAEFAELRSKAGGFPDHLRAVLTSEPFNAQAVSVAAQAVIAEHSAFESKVSTVLVEALSAMSPEGRRKFAEHPIPGPGGPPEPGGGPGAPPPPPRD